ncbi:MAG TPA: triose-phosphate isomerase [Acidimicrobiia bacterium]|jgi:triosephosphate isomerase|nr:triose-phosphate isomerase [Acidimicrobiia bacterium]
MRKDLIAGNWKMHATHLETIQMVQKLSYRLDTSDHDRVDVVVCPPFTALRSAQTVIESDNLAIRLGAQNCHWEDKGAFTGEVAPRMLSKLSVRYVIAGHSERRQLFGETDETVNRKVKAILANEMTPIMCCGETLDQREEGIAESWVEGQVKAGLSGLSAEQVAGLVIAYEPIWAIGTGKTASADDAGAMATLVRSVVDDGWGRDAADSVRVLYGGSVNPGNVAGLMAKRDIDGGLVGGASLDPDTFASVIRYWA